MTTGRHHIAETCRRPWRTTHPYGFTTLSLMNLHDILITKRWEAEDSGPHEGKHAAKESF